MANVKRDSLVSNHTALIGAGSSTITRARSASSGRLEPWQARRDLCDPFQVVRLLNLAAGARAQPAGIMVRCPGHDDSTASCSVRVTRDGALYFHCFGCAAHGDVLTLIALTTGLDVRVQFPQVLRLAAEMIDQIDQDGPVDEQLLSPEQTVSCTDAEFEKISEVILAGCPVASDAAARAYLSGRRLLEGAQRDCWAALPSGERDQMAIIDAIVGTVGSHAWQHSGLAQAGAGFRWPDHTLVIPWADERGRVAALQRRLLGPAAHGSPEYVFSSGRRAVAPYGLDAVRNRSADAPVAFVEGAIDVVSMRTLCAKRAIERAVVGLPGVSAWRAEWAHVATGRDALICLDADTAGEDMVPRMAEDLRAAGAISVLRLKPLVGKDWNNALMAETS